MTLAVPSSLVVALAAGYPWSVDPDPDVASALNFLDADPTAGDVVRAGYVGGAGVAAVAWLVPVALGVPLGPATLVAAGAGYGVARGVARLPPFLASLRRTRALGALPGVVGRVALRMRLEPAPERGVAFAARTGEGRLAESLADHARRAADTPRTGLDGFADEWSEWFPAVDRAAALLESSADAPEAERNRTLDRAVDAVAEGARDRMAAFAGDVRTPATGVYAFGVLLPLALVGVLPAARVAGVGVSAVHLALVYDVALPTGLLAAGGWLLARRPVAFPPPRVGRDHPDVPDVRWPAAVAGVGGGAAAGGLAAVAVGAWAAPVAAAGVGAGGALVARYRPVKAVRDRVRAVEAGLDDALFLVGRRVGGGEAVETAVARAAEEVPGATGEAFADAAGVQSRLRVGVREAFLGEVGAFADLPSPRARGAARLLALAAREGAPAGRSVVTMADQLSELRRIEAEGKRALDRVTGSLGNTAALFGPLVAGATVALADGLSRLDPGTTGGAAAPTAAPIPTDALGVVVGVYVLLLAALLSSLAAALDHGLDRALLGYRVGVALLAATLTYFVAFLGAGLLV